MSNQSLCLVAAFLAAFAIGIKPATAQDWNPTSAPNKTWQKVVASADADRLAAFYYGQVYISTNTGLTWITNSLPPGSYCLSAASSADGSVLLAGMQSGGICTSTNGGVTWSTNNVPQSSWQPVAISADGSRLTALASFGNLLYTSTNSGMTWTSNSPPTPTGSYTWSSMACSADGKKLALAGWQALSMNVYGGAIFTSTNSGATWQPTSAPSTNWGSIAGSADGVRLVATASYNTYSGYPHNGVFCSTNSGATWTPVSIPTEMQDYISVGCSTNGSQWVAASSSSSSPSRIYTSTNSGASWVTNNSPVATWSSLAASADGSKLIASVYGGLIYTRQAVTVLDMNYLNHSIILSWPALAASKSLGLEQNSNLATTNWVTAPPPAPSIVDGQYQVILSAPPGNNFFRLKSR